MNHTIIKRNGIREQRIGNELYLFGADGEDLSVLNATAMLIWSLCDGQHGRDDMLKIMSEIYPAADTGQLADDIEQCLSGFQAQGLITIVADDPA